MATALTPQLVAEIIRKRLNLPDSAESERIIYQIPEALKRTARKVAANPDIRNLMFTDKASATGTIASGKVDLTTLETTYRILREFLNVGQIYHSTSIYPLQEMNPQAAIGASTYLGANTNFVGYYIEGKYLVLADSALTGTLSFAVPSYPALLSQLPNSDEIHVLFFDTLVEVLQNLPADYLTSQQSPGQGADR